MGDKSIDALLAKEWDVAVVGAGYAGYAAAMVAASSGKETLLIDPLCSLLWESAHARNPIVGTAPPEMAPFLRAATCMTGIPSDWIDPGSAEWIANELLMESSVRRLYFATPVAADIAGDGTFRSVTFALRDGLVAISAAQWIDATEHGLLAGLCGIGTEVATPAKRVSRYFLQRTLWTESGDFNIQVGVPGASASADDSAWSSEKILRIETDAACAASHLSLVEPAFTALRDSRGGELAGALVSHWSYIPYPIYDPGGKKAESPCPNLALAVPGFSDRQCVTLGDRYALGIAALNSLEDAPKASKPATLPATPILPKPTLEIDSDILVAGLGTAGLFAAAAASGGGARVMAVEESAIPGGVPATGGIPSYYFGCSGGMQDALDAEVKRLMPLFCADGQLGRAYHGLARLVAADTMIARSGATVLAESRILPCPAQMNGDRITSVLAATPSGIARIYAANWIDSTGDAFLSSAAGVKLSGGREGDGRMNPFSQVWGCFGFGSGNDLCLFICNYDHGYVNPSDSLDMTEARISAIHTLVESSCVRTSNAFNRTTGVAPSIGVRQGPLAATRYKLTLDDMVVRRKFDDAIGFTSSHIDNHAKDSYAESRDLAFYYWCCGLWFLDTGCEIPYRAILAEGTGNLWVACRAAGCTAETAYAFRMQRDMQRIGEAAGLAAAMALELGVASDAIPIAKLQDKLSATGAMPPWRPKPGIFGEVTPRGLDVDPILVEPASDKAISRWIAAIGCENNGKALWRLYRLGLDRIGAKVRPLLADNGARGDSAALLLGALGDKSAAPRLTSMAGEKSAGPVPPGHCSVPRRTAATWALGFCGDAKSLGVLGDIVRDETRTDNERIAALWSIAGIASRNRLDADSQIPIAKTLNDAGLIGEPTRKGDDWRRIDLRKRRDFAVGLVRKATGLAIDEDALLMLAAARGDDAAFEKIVLRHQKPLLNFFRRSGVYTDAEDLVQQTFVRLYRYRARYSPKAKFTTFLYLAARQVRIDEVRRRIRQKELRDKIVADGGSREPVSTDAPYDGVSDDLQAALARLSDAHREVVVLGVLQELPYSEVAEILGVPVGTVKSRMFHALRELRGIFGQ